MPLLPYLTHRLGPPERVGKTLPSLTDPRLCASDGVLPMPVSSFRTTSSTTSTGTDPLLPQRTSEYPLEMMEPTLINIFYVLLKTHFYNYRLFRLGHQPPTHQGLQELQYLLRIFFFLEEPCPDQEGLASTPLRSWYRRQLQRLDQQLRYVIWRLESGLLTWPPCGWLPLWRAAVERAELDLKTKIPLAMVKWTYMSVVINLGLSLFPPQHAHNATPPRGEEDHTGPVTLQHPTPPSSDGKSKTQDPEPPTVESQCPLPPYRTPPQYLDWQMPAAPEGRPPSPHGPIKPPRHGSTGICLHRGDLPLH